MRILFLLIFLLCFRFAAFSQYSVLDKPITLKQYNTTIEKILAEIRLKYGVRFSYVNNVIPLKKRIQVDLSNKPLSEGLDKIFNSTDITYHVVNGQVVLHSDPNKRGKVVTVVPKLEDKQVGSRLKKMRPKGMSFDSSVVHSPVLSKVDVESDFEDTDSVVTRERRIAQGSLFPGLSTNGLRNSDMVNNLSINFLAGVSKAVEGIEIGLGGNIIKDHVKGGQFAAGFNMVKGRVFGGQFAGVFNYNDGYSAGGQFAGVSNVVKDNADLIQGAGVINIVNGPFNGVQLAGALNFTEGFITGVQGAGFGNYSNSPGKVVQAAGFYNICKGGIEGGQASGFINLAAGNISGFQAAGFMNVGDTVKGGQAAGFMNISSGDFRGVQVAGFLNYSNSVKGSQIGLINVSDSITGISLGFLNIVKKGYNRFEFSLDETAGISIAFKPGSRHLYNVFSFTAMPIGNNLRWRAGYGLGTDLRISDKRSLSIDGVVSQINNSEAWTKRLNLVSQIKFLYNFNYSGTKAFFVGPSINLQVYDTTYKESEKEISPYTVVLEDEGQNSIKGWVGLTAGFRH
jgi:hypothetical protein